MASACNLRYATHLPKLPDERVFSQDDFGERSGEWIVL
jgi:hypothetical protein